MIFKKIYGIYKGMVYSRADDNGCVFYFSHRDFENLKKEEYSFGSVDGHTLKGAFYYYEGFDENRLVIFDHGMGSGHRGYMKEIEMLCRNGFLVFSYDHTGCMESGGETTGGFVQSLKDLNDAVKALKNEEKYKNIINNSWYNFCAFIAYYTNFAKTFSKSCL